MTSTSCHNVSDKEPSPQPVTISSKIRWACLLTKCKSWRTNWLICISTGRVPCGCQHRANTPTSWRSWYRSTCTVLLILTWKLCYTICNVLDVIFLKSWKFLILRYSFRSFVYFRPNLTRAVWHIPFQFRISFPLFACIVFSFSDFRTQVVLVCRDSLLW